MLMAAPSAPRPRPRCCRAVDAVCANRASARIVMGAGQASLRRLQSFTSLCTLLCRLRLVAHVAHVPHVTYSLAHVARVTYSPPACHSVRLPLWSCASLTLWSCVPLTHSSCVLALLSCLFHARVQAYIRSAKSDMRLASTHSCIYTLHLHIASTHCIYTLHPASAGPYQTCTWWRAGVEQQRQMHRLMLMSPRWPSGALPLPSRPRPLTQEVGYSHSWPSTATTTFCGYMSGCRVCMGACQQPAW